MQDFYRFLPQRFVPCKKHAKSSYFRDYREMFNWFIPFELWGRITEHIKSETRKALAWRSWLKPSRERERDHLKFRPQDFLGSPWELIQGEILQTPLNFAKRLIYNWNIWKQNPKALFPLAQSLPFGPLEGAQEDREEEKRGGCVSRARSSHLAAFQLIFSAKGTRDFPGGPVVRTLCFYCRGHRFGPSSRK